MKRFIVSVLFVSVFFLGLGTLVDKAGARFRSDEKALALINAARAAIGGDSAIGSVQSLRIKGATTHTFMIDGVERIENGDTEIALQLPDKLSKMVKIGKPDVDGTGEQVVDKRVETVVIRKDKDGNIVGDGGETGGKRVIVMKESDAPGEFTTESGDKIIVRKHSGDLPLKTSNGELREITVDAGEMKAHHGAMRQNELFRLTLGLLLSGPSGGETNYTFGGETDVDGTPCNLVVAEFAGSTVKLYLNRSTNLPVMMAYTGGHLPVMTKFKRKAAAGDANEMVFLKKVGSPGEGAEFQVRFSDYRSVGGVQLPYRWTTTAGETREVFDVSVYEVNPLNIADSFKDHKVMIRTKKPDGQ